MRIYVKLLTITILGIAKASTIGEVLDVSLVLMSYGVRLVLTSYGIGLFDNMYTQKN